MKKYFLECLFFTLLGQFALADLVPKNVTLNSDFKFETLVEYTLSPTKGVFLTADSLDTVYKNYSAISSILRNKFKGKIVCLGGIVSMQIQNAEAVYFESSTTCFLTDPDFEKEIDDFVSSQLPIKFYDRKIKWTKPEILTTEVSFDTTNDYFYPKIQTYLNLSPTDKVDLFMSFKKIIETQTPSASDFSELLKKYGVSDSNISKLIESLKQDNDLVISFHSIVKESEYSPYYNRVGLIPYDLKCNVGGCFK